jgi:hypothetical protein
MGRQSAQRGEPPQAAALGTPRQASSSRETLDATLSRYNSLLYTTRLAPQKCFGELLRITNLSAPNQRGESQVR